jgi:hypothetical protein
VKKYLLALAAALLATPALAWHPIVVRNNTDPVLVHKVIFSAPGILDEFFTVNVPKGQVRVFGPLPETGPCLREIRVDVMAAWGEAISTPARTPMDVCNETWINVTGYWPRPNNFLLMTPIVVTHGR